MSSPTGFDNPGRVDRFCLWLLLAVVIGFGGLVEVRSAFQPRRMGDLSVFLRAAWAVRAGEDIYAITEENGWHYVYPPLLAVLLAPFADPPPGVDLPGAVPYAVSVGLWYAFGIACTFWATHSLAAALEASSPWHQVRDTPPGCRRWWYLRLMPFLVSFLAIGNNLSRAQTNLLMLALLAGMTAAALRGRSWKAGLLLAGAVCLKVFPAYLLIVPVLRRDWRWLGGCAAGLVLGVVAIPAVAIGPTRTWDLNREFVATVLAPGVGASAPDGPLAEELHGMTATDNQAFVSVIHNWKSPLYWAKPPAPDTATRLWHLLCAAAIGLTTLATFGWRRSANGPEFVTFMGALIIAMIVSCPVCHMPYFCLTVVPVSGLLAGGLQRTGELRLGWAMRLLFAAHVGLAAWALWPGLESARDHGVALGSVLCLWAAATAALLVRWRATVAGLVAPLSLARAA